MFDFVLGAAFVLLPQQHQVPLVICSALIKGIQGIRKKQRAQNIANSRDAGDDVVLEWSQLTCTLEEKNGNERFLLQDIQGFARPGRLLAICGPSGSGVLCCDEHRRRNISFFFCFFLAL